MPCGQEAKTVDKTRKYERARTTESEKIPETIHYLIKSWAAQREGWVPFRRNARSVRHLGISVLTLVENCAGSSSTAFVRERNSRKPMWLGRPDTVMLYFWRGREHLNHDSWEGKGSGQRPTLKQRLSHFPCASPTDSKSTTDRVFYTGFTGPEGGRTTTNESITRKFIAGVTPGSRHKNLNSFESPIKSSAVNVMHI